MILARILTPEARERLSRIALVKDDRARQIQDMLIGMASSGQLVEKVDENKLKALLSQLTSTQQKSKITIQRKKRIEDEDDIDYSDL